MNFFTENVRLGLELIPILLDEKNGKTDIKIPVDISIALDTFKDMMPILPEGLLWYELRGVHLGKGVAKGKTKDDVYRAFLFWAQKEEDIKANVFNITKALRRFLIFAFMQEKHYSETGWIKDPVYLSDFELSQNVCPIYVSSEPLKGTPADNSLDGCILWGIDVPKLKIKDIDFTQPGCNTVDIFRSYWYLILSSVFDKTTQRRGIVLVDNVGKLSWKDYSRYSNGILGSNNEEHWLEIFSGWLPIKFKKYISVNSPWWNSLSIGIAKLFLSRKMSSRVKVDSMKKMYSRIGGKQNLPYGFMGGDIVNADMLPSSLFGIQLVQKN